MNEGRKERRKGGMKEGVDEERSEIVENSQRF